MQPRDFNKISRRGKLTFRWVDWGGVREGGGDARNPRLHPVEGQARKASNEQASSSTLIALVCVPMAVNQVPSLNSTFTCRFNLGLEMR
jgi:hypothetical protein